MARKEWELLFNLSAKQNSNFSSTFKAAQSALVETQNKIQQLNKVQSDITAYQKQQQAVDSTKQRLAVLQQQYDNIQKEIQETEGYSSALENKLISSRRRSTRPRPPCTPMSSVWLPPGTPCGKLAWTPRS